MELAPIEMPRQEARQAFLEYRRAVRERHNAEDEMIMRGYRALSQGKQVINLLDVMKGAGADDKGRPKLAVARADLKRVGLQRWPGGGFTFDMPEKLQQSRSAHRVSFPTGTLPRETLIGRRWDGSTGTLTRLDAEAIVPSIPPQLRPATALSNYHILWEAEWRAVPADPALLKHVGGWLYAVLAVWDLTPLEQAVLGLTRN